MQGIRISNIWRRRSDSGRESPTRPSVGGWVGGSVATVVQLEKACKVCLGWAAT